MVNSTGSDDLGGVNQSAVNTFGNAGFWFEWIEFSNSARNLTEAGFDTSDGSILPGTTIYNAGSTDDLNSLATNASASVLGNDVTGDRALFGIRATTTLTVTNAGTYTFDVRSDDGVILYVDGVQVVNDDSLHAPRNRAGSIDLTPGEHEIIIIYFERTGQNVLEVDIQSDPGGDYPTQILLQDANVQANAGNDTVDGRAGDDVIDGGAGSDTLIGGAGDDILDGGAGTDTLTGGDGDDVFAVSSGADTITDFNAGNSGPIDDGDQTNNDFVDLSGFYNASTLDAVNNADADPGNDFVTELGMLRADAADGTIDGVIGGTDYSAEIGGIDLTLQNGGAAVTGNAITFDNTNVACFTQGTLIDVASGAVAIETLRVGDKVRTLHNGLRPVRWIACRRLDAADLAYNPNLRPVRIRAGALGVNTPARDLVVSPQHRVLVRSKIAERMFETRDVLVSARKLLVLDGVEVAHDFDTVDYYHIMFDRHQIVFSNGAATESMFAGPEALRALPDAARLELLALFEDLQDPDCLPQPAALIPEGGKQKRLVARHAKNRRRLFEA
ncbi:Hint domain-containing protein [Tropicimonas sp. S265A]|uniref:Hint domain-containing protein n=1 Tax=Tropicimonas sp. S265A TaxID=3415134 RepID=UPI003C7B7D19